MNPRLTLLALVAFNLLVKLLWLGQNELAHDEPFTVYWSQRPLAEFKAMLLTENNPPLHFLITRWWSALVPFEAAWLRVPSAVFSALAVWPLHAIAHRLSNARVALVAALLFTFSNYHYGFAHEARAYALFTLLAIWSLWLVVRESGKASIGWAAILQLALVNALMAWTHYLGWLMVVVQLLVALVVPGLRAWRRAHPMSTLITAVLFAPNAVIFLTRASTSLAHGTWLGPPVPEELYNMVWRWSNAPVVAVLMLIVIVAAVLRSPWKRAAFMAGLAWSLIPLAAIFVASQWVPIFLDRYLVFIAPGFALLVAAAIDALDLPARWTRLIGAAAVLAMAVTFGPWQTGTYRPSGVVAQVNAWCDGDCHVEVVPSWYWLNFMAALDMNNLSIDQSALLRASVLRPDSEQASALGNYLLVDASGSAESSELRTALREIFTQADSAVADHRVTVYRFRN